MLAFRGAEGYHMAMFLRVAFLWPRYDGGDSCVLS